MPIYIENDNDVSVTISDRDGTRITDAVVYFDVTDSAGDYASGMTFPANMVHQGNGVYLGVLDAELSVSAGQSYALNIWSDTDEGYFSVTSRFKPVARR